MVKGYLTLKVGWSRRRAQGCSRRRGQLTPQHPSIPAGARMSSPLELICHALAYDYMRFDMPLFSWHAFGL
jgi:hypothetical protein